MIPSALASQTMARALESEGHEMGWDNTPPALVYLGGVVEGGTTRALMSLPAPVPPDFFSENGGQMLRTLGHEMLIGQLREMAADLAQVVGADFAGAGFVMEAWMGKVSPEARAGRRLADIPGSVEIRTAIVLDCAGRVAECHRVRGKKPVTTTWQPDDPDRSFTSGNVLVGLRDIVLAVASRIPSGSADLDAISKVVTEESIE